MVFEQAWNVLKARTERNYPAELQQGRAGTQTQHNRMNMESRLDNPPGRVRSQGKQQAIAQILEGMNPKKDNVRDIDVGDTGTMNPAGEEYNEDEMRRFKPQKSNVPVIGDEMGMAAMRALMDR
tara:strand:- start:2123 stop:2494 length:372 start_codon:yes stop_codon:yes gene_type:complete